VTVEPLPLGEQELKLLVLQHSRRAPGAEFCKELERQGAVLTMLWPGKDDVLPESHDGFHGLVILGGPQHAYDDAANPHFRPLLALMRAFDNAGKPVAGICLGSQLLARAHGANVRSMGDLEFGFTEMLPSPRPRPTRCWALPCPRPGSWNTTKTVSTCPGGPCSCFGGGPAPAKPSAWAGPPTDSSSTPR
jgi:hypothetical protein